MLRTSSKNLIFLLLSSIFHHQPGQCDLKEYIIKMLREKQNISSHMEPRIVRGAPVDIERYPWSVLVFNSGSVCAGTILNVYTILSAAHCFGPKTTASDITVHVGSRYLYDHNALEHTVKRINNHEDFNIKSSFSCDIALLFLNRPIKFCKTAQRVDLIDHGRWMNKNEQGFSVLGWGVIKHNGPLSEHGLLMATMKYIPRRECNVMHQLNLTADMFCLYGGAHKDSCNGDSGGGVLWKGYLVGIVSHGEGCGSKNKPSVYANVWYFRNWIYKKITEQTIHFNGTFTNIDRLHPEMCANIESGVPTENDTTSSQFNNDRLINVEPYLHQYDKNRFKDKKRLVKLTKVSQVKQGKVSAEYSDDEFKIDKLIVRYKNTLRQDNADQVDKLVAKNKYIKLRPAT